MKRGPGKAYEDASPDSVHLPVQDETEAIVGNKSPAESTHDSSVELPPQPKRPPGMPRAGRQTKHRWCRVEVDLPRLNVEHGLYSKILDCVRQRRKQEDNCMAVTSTRANVYKSERRASSAPSSPSLSTVTSKFLSSACLPPGCAQQWREESLQQVQRAQAMTPRPRSWTPPEILAEIVEAPLTMTVTLDANREFKVPPGHWLVLEPRCQAGGSTSSSSRCGNTESVENTTGESELLLAGEAGGGVIHETVRTQGLLRTIAPQRMKRSHAEANFRRAVRGSCALSLVHATLIMRLVDEADAETAEHDRRGLSSSSWSSREVIEGRHRTIYPHSARSTQGQQNPFDGWARRAYRLVFSQAVQAEKRKEMTQAPQGSRSVMCATPSSTFGAATPSMMGDAPASWKSNPKKLKLLKGYHALQDFINYAYTRFGNPVRVWFKLDPQENMKLGERQFLRGCESINFTGNAAALWRYIDSDQSGSVTILELHPPSAMMLARFKQLIQPKGTTVQEAFKFLDDNSSMRVYKGEFVAQLRALNFDGPAPRLFDLLDRRMIGFLSIEDIMFLDKWQPPPYIFSEPSIEGLRRVKQIYCEMKGNLLAAWRKALDRDGTMRVSWDEWRHACSELQKTGAHGIPRSIDEIAAVWRAMDEDCSGWIALREWDLESFDIVAEFKRWADHHHGGVVKAFRALDGSANSKLSEGELKKAARGSDGVKGNLELFFDGFREKNKWELTEHDVKFLDDWDLDWEDWEVAAVQAGRPLLAMPGERKNCMPKPGSSLCSSPSPMHQPPAPTTPTRLPPASMPAIPHERLQTPPSMP